jgi:hypothetical protein
MIQVSGPPHPPVGNMRHIVANTTINRIDIAKLGTVMPNVDRIVVP